MIRFAKPIRDHHVGPKSIDTVCVKPSERRRRARRVKTGSASGKLKVIARQSEPRRARRAPAKGRHTDAGSVGFRYLPEGQVISAAKQATDREATHEPRRSRAGLLRRGRGGLECAGGGSMRFGLCSRKFIGNCLRRVLRKSLLSRPSMNVSAALNRP